MPDRAPRLTRRAAVIVTAGAAALVVREATTRSQGDAHTVIDFGRMRDGRGWGRQWHLQHYDRRLAVEAGSGVLELPAGLATTAPDQPTPVFLLDHACSDCRIDADLEVDNATARPGLLIGARSPFDYAAVTVEAASRLVLARYQRAGRVEIAGSAIPPLSPGAAFRLSVEVAGDRVRAGIGPAGGMPSWQLDGRLPVPPAGTPGIILVHPTDFRAVRLRLRRFAASAGRRFRETRPEAAYLLAGIPAVDARGSGTVLLRMGSAFPARVRFEWAPDGDWRRARRSGWLSAERPPFTAVHRAPIGAGGMHWRVRLQSASSAAETVTPAASVAPPDPGRPLVMLAASCVEFGGMPPTYGYSRLIRQAAAPPAAMVFQGDMGYANNKFHSCYLDRADYFAERFTRFLADPRFAELRRNVSVGFTIDDHDYGPRNNADRTTAQPWAWQLWNRMHADPSTTGYFDFRFGDVHCLTLDGRRYADPIWSPNRPGKTKLGTRQLAWMESIMQTSDARLFVVFSADTFASRYLNPGSTLIADCFIDGWPDEYHRVMTVFGRVQAGGRRVVVMSGDAHSLRIHYHPPGGAHAPDAAAVVEFICSGLRPRHWFGAAAGDPTLDPLRHVLNHAGAGMMTVDPPGDAARSVTLRAISGERTGPADLFPPLVLPFLPTGPPSPVARV